MKLKSVAAILCLMPLLLSDGKAATVFQHTGSADPATEGWTVFRVGTEVTGVPVMDDFGTGLAAWSILDPTIMAGSLAYMGFPSVADAAAAKNFGWELTVNLRVVDAPDPPSSDAFPGAIYAEYLDGSTRFGMSFGAQADGDPIVQFFRGPTFVLEGGGRGYHLYKLRYDPIGLSADLFVDGVERVSDFQGLLAGFAESSLTPEVIWGAFGGQFELGHGNYNKVEFTVVPEPSLMTISAVALVLYWLFLGPRFIRRPCRREFFRARANRLTV